MRHTYLPKQPTRPADPTRTRKLLLNRREIDKLTKSIAQDGTSCPLRLFWKKNRVKCQIALAKGKSFMTNDNLSKKKTSLDKKPEILKTLADNTPLISGIALPLTLGFISLYGLGSTTYTLILAAVLAYLTLPITQKIAAKGIRAKSIHLGFTLIIMLTIGLFLLVEVPHTINQLGVFLSALPANILIFISFIKKLIISYGVHRFIESELTEHLSEIILKAQCHLHNQRALVSMTANQVNNIITYQLTYCYSRCYIMPSSPIAKK